MTSLLSNIKFLENIFSRFGTPRTIISNNGTHFCNKSFEALVRKYVIAHKLSTPYHPQTKGQVEVSHRQIKLILENTVSQNRKNWSTKLVDTLIGLQDRFQNYSRNVSL